MPSKAHNISGKQPWERKTHQQNFLLLRLWIYISWSWLTGSCPPLHACEITPYYLLYHFISSHPLSRCGCVSVIMFTGTFVTLKTGGIRGAFRQKQILFRKLLMLLNWERGGEGKLVFHFFRDLRYLKPDEGRAWMLLLISFVCRLLSSFTWGNHVGCGDDK